MRQPLNTNPRLDEQVRRALNKIKRPSTAEEITELLNQELSPGDNPFSEAEVERRLRDSREKVLELYWLRNRPLRWIFKPHRRRSGCGWNPGNLTLLSLSLREHRILGPATDTKILPQPEPGTVGEGLIMPSIRSRDIACADGPDVRCLEHFLKLPDVINNAFNVHPEQYSESAFARRSERWFAALNHQPWQNSLKLRPIALEK
jgi:hypothetical protein